VKNVVTVGFGRFVEAAVSGVLWVCEEDCKLLAPFRDARDLVGNMLFESLHVTGRAFADADCGKRCIGRRSARHGSS